MVRGQHKKASIFCQACLAFSKVLNKSQNGLNTKKYILKVLDTLEIFFRNFENHKNIFLEILDTLKIFLEIMDTLEN